MKCNEIMRNTDENNINFANHNKLATNYVGNFIEAKILTAQYQAVGILYGAPDRYKHTHSVHRCTILDCDSENGQIF